MCKDISEFKGQMVSIQLRDMDTNSGILLVPDQWFLVFEWVVVVVVAAAAVARTPAETTASHNPKDATPVNCTMVQKPK